VGIEKQDFDRDYFAPLFQSLSLPNTKVVLALGGGGVRMFAHAVVFEFLEKIGVSQYLSEVWGASGGALMAFAYSLGLTPDEMKKIGAVAFNGEIVPQMPSYMTLIKRIFVDIFSSSKESASLQVFREYQRRLEKYLRKLASERSQRCKFFCTGFNLETQENDVLSSEVASDCFGTDKVYQVDNIDAVMASSAVPILFEPRTISDKFGTRTYIDAALIEDVPTQSVYKKWIHDKELGIEKSRFLVMIAVNLYPSSFDSTNLLGNSRLRRLPGFEHVMMSLNCAEFMRQAATKAQKKLLQQDPNVELWDLNITIPNGSLLSLDLIPRVLEVADEAVPLEFRKICEKLIY